MEQWQKGSPKSAHIVSSGPQTYNIVRMSSVNDKALDKLMSSSSTPKSPREKQNRSNPVTRQQEKMFSKKQDQKPDNKQKSRHLIQHEKKPEYEEKVDNRYNVGEDHLQDNRNDVNRMNQGEMRQDNRFNLNPVVKNSLNQKDDAIQQAKDNIPSQGNHEAISNSTENVSSEEIINIQSGESVERELSGEVISDIDKNLPPTAVLLTTEGGSKIYLVGTVHFSLESQKDVADVIRAVRPDCVVIELCLARSYMLQWNEDRVLKEAQQLKFSAMRQVIRKSGLVQGGLYLLMLSLTVQVTKQLGIAPGGEFRAAYREASNVPNCILLFGDRPLEITLQRMLASLSVWQMTKIVFAALFQNEKISKEDVEKCKKSDVLETMLMNISQELPEFANVVLNERDLYLTHSLQVAAQRGEPSKIVGVVGIGHLPGIQRNWGKVKLEEVEKIMAIPPPRKSMKYIKFGLKFACIGLIAYGIHKMASKSVRYSNLFSDQSYWNLSNMMYDIWDSPVIQM